MKIEWITRMCALASLGLGACSDRPSPVADEGTGSGASGLDSDTSGMGWSGPADGSSSAEASGSGTTSHGPSPDTSNTGDTTDTSPTSTTAEPVEPPPFGGCGEGLVPVCPALTMAAGDVTISDAASLAAAECHSSIAGDLFIEGMSEVSLPHLQTLGGALNLHQNQTLTSLYLPALIEAHAIYAHEDTAIESIDLGALQTVDGDLYFAQGSSLTCLDLGVLQAVGGHVYFSEQLSLLELDFPALQTVGDNVYFSDQTSLVALGLPALQAVGGHVSFYRQTSLVELGLPALQTVEEHVSFSSQTSLVELFLPALQTVGSFVHFHDQPSLVELDLPALTSAERYVYFGQNGLQTLSMPLLADIGVPADLQPERQEGFPYVYIDDSPALGTCQDWLPLLSSLATPLAAALVNGEPCAL